jgi:predicted nucleic acid-binding Zn ribbon protein
MRKCPRCGGTVEQVLSAPAIQFKGSGWYVTDYSKKSGSVEAGKSEKAESGKVEGKEKKETKSESGGSEKSSEKSGEKSTEKKAKSTAKEK